MTLLTVAFNAAVVSLAITGAMAQGDPEALVPNNMNKPTKSWEQWQPKPTYALADLPDQYMGAKFQGEVSLSLDGTSASKTNGIKRVNVKLLGSMTSPIGVFGVHQMAVTLDRRREWPLPTVLQKSMVPD